LAASTMKMAISTAIIALRSTGLMSLAFDSPSRGFNVYSRKMPLDVAVARKATHATRAYT
jgi:hypothetical protein